MAHFDAAKAIFALVDTNKDGRIDPNEFHNWVAGGGSAGGLSSSSYESSSVQSSTGGLDASSSGLAFSGNAGFGGGGGYEASYSSQSGFESAGGVASSSSEFAQSSSATLGSSNLQYSGASGVFNDPNPQIIKRAALGGAVTYQQKILVRFLQPPALPPPGPLIIKEIRPPQPPPPPPLVVRQQAPPLPHPPPLILRERPPVPPASVASQTIVRHLAALPVPPRSVVIERLPPLPPRPRDIIIERWVPYGAQAKRRTIVQRAAAAKEYARPRNLVIVYDAVQTRIVRQFQRLGVTPENPQIYVSRYGALLLDAATLVRQARAAGVVEDISPPAAAQFSGSTFSSSAGYDISNSSSSQNVASLGDAAGFEGFQVAGGIGNSYSSESYSASSSYGAEGGFASGRAGGFDLAAASFVSADTNHDGSLDRSEFERFVQGGL